MVIVTLTEIFSHYKEDIMGKRLSDLDRIISLMIVLEDKGILTDNDKDYINGNIPFNKWCERREKERDS